MNKICTDVKQSKKLVELGLDVSTADMHYFPQSENDYMLFAIPFNRKEAIDEGWAIGIIEKIVPTWSLSALMDLMPPIAYNYPVLQRSADPKYHYGETYNKWFISYVDLNIHGEHRPYRTAFYENPIDAAYSMIIFLIEQGYIKTEKK